MKNFTEIRNFFVGVPLIQHCKKSTFYIDSVFIVADKIHCYAHSKLEIIFCHCRVHDFSLSKIMSTFEKYKTKRASFSEENLNDALKAVYEEGMSLRRAAEHFRIPFTTFGQVHETKGT